MKLFSILGPRGKSMHEVPHLSQENRKYAGGGGGGKKPSAQPLKIHPRPIPSPRGGGFLVSHEKGGGRLARKPAIVKSVLDDNLTGAWKTQTAMDVKKSEKQVPHANLADRTRPLGARGFGKVPRGRHGAWRHAGL